MHREENTTKTELNIQALWDHMKRCLICITGIPEDKTEKMEKEDFKSQWPKVSKAQIWEAQRTPHRINTKTK